MNDKENELSELPKENGFRLRGIEMTRLETFMDAAFAFSITMLVISVGEIPNDYSELLTSLKEIPAFLASFFVIMIFWLTHRSWSRYYGLEDNVTIFLSIQLIFALLVFIYPLRLIFSSLFNWISGGALPSKFPINFLYELKGLFTIYGIGLFTIAGIISLLYWRSFYKRNELQLNNFEVSTTKKKIASLTVVASTGLLAALLAFFLPDKAAVNSVFIYLSLPITMPLARRYFKTKDA